MFKARLIQNKFALLSFATAVVIIVWILVNLALLVPPLITVFSTSPIIGNRQLIDAQTVNKAMELLNE